MTIYILRHGIAVERGTPSYSDDSKRPLTPEGRKKMIKITGAMKARGLRVDAILSSPYVRAKATADIAAEALGISTAAIHVTPHLTPDASFDALIKEMRSRFKSSKKLMLVGHEPHLSGFISYLLTGTPDVAIDLKKGGLCALECSRPAKATATLCWLLTPAHMCFNL